MNKLLTILIVILFSSISNVAIAGDDGKLKLNGNNNNGYKEVGDCFEKVNRGVFAFNQALDKVIFNKTKVPVLNAVLDVTQLRQRVIANNIANVSTKGYRKQDVQFKEYLESFVRKPAVEGQVTNGRHVPIPRPIAHPIVYEPETSLNDSGLNNVDIDREMADLAENHLFFNVGQRLMRGQFDGLKKSISGRTG